jgi:dTDP-4-dehydrorhamnose 3,5-epimerase
LIFEPTPIEGAFVIRIERHEDERGFFARLWCRDEFAAHGIDVGIAQASVSYNRLAGTLRGMHFSRPPACEGKLVRCGRGRVHDVLLDLRTHSPAFMRHVGIELDALQYNAVYVPPGVAHGFQTLVDDAEVVYMMTEAYRAECADGVRFDDPAFGIRWPLPVRCIAARDKGYHDFRVDDHRARYAAKTVVAPPAGRSGNQPPAGQG